MPVSRTLQSLLLSGLIFAANHLCAVAANSPVDAKAADTPPSTVTGPYFRIRVVDQDTSRGIPMVKLQITNRVTHWTDSAGVVAFCEPDLWGQRVWFTVESNGYKNDNAPMGFNGVVLEPTPGGSAVIPMRRTNIAQRIYRMTGSGIYRDSILLGDPHPEVEEAGKVPVSGQDGGDVMLFKDKLYWLWGDTGIVRFPLGVYQGTCAVSEPPGRGGLDPDQGVALRYFRREDGDPKPIINLPLKPGHPYWYTYPRTVTDTKGDQHLVTDYTKVGAKMEPVERGLVEFNEETAQFDLVTKYPDHPIFETAGGGTAVFRYRSGGVEHFYNPCPWPTVRYPTDYASQADMSRFEAFTCLKEGSTFDGSTDQLDRDSAGNLRWAWRNNTSPILEAQMDRLIKSKAMRPEERWYAPTDVLTGKPVLSHHGSVYWNPYRQRWISIRLQNWGETLVGELWYFEGDTPLGPWVYGTKIVSHAWKDHTAAFYTPAQIPYFDKDGGRTIYLKGSFSAEFGDDKTAPPRDVYNIIMYKLDLGDERLVLPVPVYREREGSGRIGTKTWLAGAHGDLDLVWFANDRPSSGTIPIYEVAGRDGKGVELTTKRGANPFPVFYAPPGNAEVATSSPLALTLPLYEFVNSETRERAYGFADAKPGDGFARASEPLCRVWPSPIKFNPYGKAPEHEETRVMEKKLAQSFVKAGELQWAVRSVSPQSEPMGYAVAEFGKYLKQITGRDAGTAGDAPGVSAVTIGLRKDLSPADASLLPEPKPGFDGYSVAVVKGNAGSTTRVVIGADCERGAVYAVYDLLERMGCRWFYPQKDPKDAEVVPAAQDALLQIDRWSVASPFRFRVFNCLEPAGTTTDTIMLDYDWAMKCRYNTVDYSHVKEAKRRGLMVSAGGHCFDQFLRNEDYFKNHPEWFGLQNGKRVPQAFGGSQFCWSNAEARRTFAENFEKYLRDHPDIDLYGFCGGDGQPACTCAECAKLNPADWEIQIVNECMARVKQQFPNTVFMVAGAYAPCAEPPLVTQPDPDMVCTWAHWGRHHGSGFSDERYGMKENLDAWSRAFSGRLIPFQYYSDHFAEPWVAAPYAAAIMGDRQYLRECGALGFSNLMYPSGYWWNWGLNNYLAGRCFYDADADAMEIIEDYACNYFGSDLMAKYCREWAENLSLAYGVRGGATNQDRAMLAKQRRDYIEPALKAAKGDATRSHRLGKVEKLHGLAGQLMAIQKLQQESEAFRAEGEFKRAGEKIAAARKSVEQTSATIQSLIDLKQGLVDPELLAFFFPRVRDAIDREAKAVEQESKQKQGREEKEATPADQVPPQ